MKLKWKKLSTRVMSFYKLRKLLSFEVDIEAATDSVPLKKYVLENFSKFAEQHLCQRLFFNKVEG